jgi:AraC-like DNA-binding protein
VEIFFFASGSGTHIVGDREYMVKENSFAIIHYGQVHTILTEGMSIYNIYLDPKRMPHPPFSPDLQLLFDKYFPLSPGLKHELNSVRHFQFNGEKSPKDLLIRMKNETDIPGSGRIFALRQLYQLFILDCLRIIKEIPVEKKYLKASDARVETIRIYIEDHLNENLSPENLSLRFGFNKQYLCRRFKEYTGKTICRYTVSARIQSILPALRDSERNICEIAYESGFNDLSYFNRSFRKIIGSSPGEYIQCNSRLSRSYNL